MESNNLNVDTIKHMAVITVDYPAPDHMMLVFVQQLVHAMIDQGAKITVVAPQSIVHALVHREKLLSKVSIATTAQGKEYKVYRPLILTVGHFRLFKKIILRINRRVIAKTLNLIKADTLYAHFWSEAQLVSEYATEHKRPLFVACGEGDNALEEMIDHSSLKEVTALCSSVKGVISVSSENKRKCILFHLADEKSIIVLPNCVDTELFKMRNAAMLKKKLGLSEEDFVIAFVGGFIPRKGPDRLAEAIKSINDPTIKSIFIGKPFPGYPLDFNCSGIVFKDVVNHDELPEYLSCADIFVLPTQKEGCCNAIVEALAMGLPVISSDGPFNDDILDSNNSIRVDPNNVAEIAEAIVKLRDDKRLRDSMRTVSLGRNRMYSMSNRATKILEFIGNQIEKNL